MDETLRRVVRDRAAHRCEYCHLPQAGYEERFSIDHVRSRKHGGQDLADNLALSCLRCNLFKGTDLTAIDPDTSSVVRIFDPRRDNWAEHFRWNEPLLVGLTQTGRATVTLLRMNAPERIRLRQALILEGIVNFD